MKSWKLIGAWVAVLVVTTTLTWQIVALADNQVSDAPAAVAPAGTSQAGDSTTTAPTTTTSLAGTSTIRTTPSTSTPGSSESTSSSSASTSSSSSSTLSAVLEWSLRTIATEGGTVIVRYRPNEVELQAATPTPGFEMQIDDDGPPRVRVEFEKDDTDIRVEARWANGGLDVEVSGES